MHLKRNIEDFSKLFFLLIYYRTVTERSSTKREYTREIKKEIIK